LIPTNNRAIHENTTKTFLQSIPREQTIQDKELSMMNRPVKKEQVRSMIYLTKNRSTTGMDGCPYELWKKLISEHKKREKDDILSFDITQTLMTIIQDI
jgi:hypothetical protein